jgi:(S)-2-hydroxy-acid oxidase
MSTTIYGTKVDLPLGISPSAFHKLAHPIGEIGTSRAATKANIPMALSTYSTTAVEDVVAEGLGSPYAMQLSLMKSRAANLELIKRAEGEHKPLSKRTTRSTSLADSFRLTVCSVRDEGDLGDG